MPNQIFGGIVIAHVKHAKVGELKFIWSYLYHNVLFVSKNRTNDIPKPTRGYGTELFYPNSCQIKAANPQYRADIGKSFQ